MFVRWNSDLLNTLTIQQAQQKIDELFDEWTPEALGAPPHPRRTVGSPFGARSFWCKGPRPKLVNTCKQVSNLASYNFTGLAGNENGSSLI